MKKKLLRVCSLAVIVLLLMSVVGGLVACKSKTEQSIFLFYTTDTHGYIANDEDTIGLDVIAALKKSETESILLDAGDYSHGLPIATLTKGKNIISLMKQVGYDAAAMGNHEFNYGQDVLNQNVSDAKAGDNPMHIICANIYKTSDGTRMFTPYITKIVKGIKIGIFSLTSLDTVVQSLPVNIAGMEFKDPKQEAEKAVSELKADNCDIIVGLVHLGSDAGESSEIAQLSGIDVVIDGHSHVVLDEKVAGKAHLVSLGEFGNNVGKLEIVHSKRNGVVRTENTLLDKAATSDIVPLKSITDRIDEIVADQNKILDEVLTTIPFDLLAEKAVVRTSETNLGNLMADAVLAATGADFAIINGGGIRATLKAGNVTIGDTLTVFPYSNLIVTKKISGAQLYVIMEHSASSLPAADGRFAQVGGFKVTIDAAKPVGQRIVSITKMDGTLIDKEAIYTLATNSYIADGGDSYPVLASLPVFYQGSTEDEVFIQYLKTCNISDYEFTQGRIKFV